MELDVIIPAYNEEENLVKLYETLETNLSDIKHNLIFIDDGSKDNTYNVLESLYKKNSNIIKVIRFSRNFGKDAAIYAGLKRSKASYACIIDADLQQNPKLIKDMLKVLKENEEYDMVAMVNDYSNESFLSKTLKKSFYFIMNKACDQKFKAGASDFRLLRDYVVKSLVSMSENNRFTKGLFSWVGYNTYYMDYKAGKREFGKSKFRLKKQINYATDGLINFSTKPLRIATFLGSIISGFALVYLIIVIIGAIINNAKLPPYTTMMCVILLLGGIQLLVIGIMGEYISKSYIEAKNRPIYIEKSSLGYNDDIL